MFKIQQGDVVLVKINQIPKEAKKDNTKSARVVQEGEHTGHAHRMTEAGQVYSVGEQKYVRVESGYALLSHEEHNTEVIEQGDYEVRIVRQKDPFSKLVSRVVD